MPKIQDYLNQWGWKPNNYVDPIAERMLHQQMCNIRLPGQQYSWVDPVSGYRGERAYEADEYFAGETYQYLPVGNARYERAGHIQLAQHNSAFADYGEAPYQNNSPSPMQLTHALYQGANELWQEIRKNNSTTDWGIVE